MINKITILGNLGQDPEVRYTQSGTCVCTFTVATSEKWKDKDGNMQEETEWHRIVAWKRLGEICGEYLKKGQQVYLEGKNKTRKWQDNDGKDRYTTEIVIREMKMVGRKDGSSGGSGGDSYQGGGTGDQGGGTGEDFPF